MSAAKGPGHRYDARTRRRARRLYSQHQWAITRIGRYLDVPEGTVRSWVRDLNPGTGNERRYDRAAILADVDAELSRAEIVEKHGCSQRFLSDLINGKIPP